MNPKYRKTVIGGNWKMNLLPSEVKGYAESIKKYPLDTPNLEIIIAVPFIMLPEAINAFHATPVHIAAQNVSEHAFGAYTGEVSATQLADLGIDRVIVGHSERRAYFRETNAIINKKIHASLKCGLDPILCVGESKDVREMGSADDLISFQVKSALHGISHEELRRITIAYEPVWAIGTGNVATPIQAEAMCARIRSVVADMFGAALADTVTIIYGGSMDGENASELLSLPNIDGGLIGKASLTPDSFFRIIQAAKDTL